MTFEPAAKPPAVVLDTNTLLDWLVFEDPCMTALAAAVHAGQVRWLVCTTMRDELCRTLGYANLAKWKPDSERVLSCFDSLSRLAPPPAPAPLNLRCSDPDDQVFLDLALAGGARWLVTHDRALLQLARRSQAHGLHILKPGHWQLS